MPGNKLLKLLERARLRANQQPILFALFTYRGELIIMAKVEKEEWKEIMIGNEIKITVNYSVSNLGNVRNDYTGKYLIPFRARGYWVVKLSVGKQEFTMYVHRLVAVNFVKGRTSKKNEVDHVDGNKNHNYASNLEWVTRSEQIKRAYKLGLIKPKRGEDNVSAKYSEKLVRKICEELEKCNDVYTVRTNLGLPRSYRHLISKIKRGVSWRHVSKEYTFLK